MIDNFVGVQIVKKYIINGVNYQFESGLCSSIEEAEKQADKNRLEWLEYLKVAKLKQVPV